LRRGRRESALRKQRRPPGRPRARRPRHPRHGTVRHHRRPVRPQAWPRSQAQAQRCRAGLFGRRPSAARVRQRTPLAAVRRPTAGPSVLVPADPLGLQPPAAPGRVLVAVALGDLAARAPSWWDELRLVDSTPVPCAASRQTVRRSALAGHAGYGYCKSHHRYFWGFRLYVLATPDGVPVAWCLATPKLGEREVVAAMLNHERARLRPGLLILGDKGLPVVTSNTCSRVTGRGWCGPIAATSRTGMARWAAGASGSRAPSTPSKTSWGWNATGAELWLASGSGSRSGCWPWPRRSGGTGRSAPPTSGPWSPTTTEIPALNRKQSSSRYGARSLRASSHPASATPATKTASSTA